MNFTLCMKLASYAMAAILLSEAAVLGQEPAAGVRSTTLFISDSGNSPADVPPTSVAKKSGRGSLVVVETAAASNPETTASPQAKISPPKARGDLVFVSDRSKAPNQRPRIERPHPSVAALASQQPVEPVAALPAPPHVVTPRSEEPIQLANHLQPVVEPQQRAAVASPPVPKPKRPAPLPTAPPPKGAVKKPRPIPLDPVDALLLRANQESQQAKSEAEYSSIINQCVEAIRLQAPAKKKIFARRLASWALNRRGQLRMDAGRDDLANSDFQSALDYNANNWRALHNRGVSYAQAGQFAEAFDDFNQVIDENPNYAKAYANRATLYVQANDLNAALEDYQKAVDADDQLATAYIGIARACHTLGRLDEAVEHFGAAVRTDPTNPNVLCSRADLLADLGRYREALADYARTIELDHEFGHAYRNGAWMLATCPVAEFRDAENAVMGAQQALELGYGERHVALDTLAAAQASAGDFQQATATEKEAVDLAPDEIKFTYLARLQQYQEGQPFRTQPVDATVSQVIYEATDQ